MAGWGTAAPLQFGWTGTNPLALPAPGEMVLRVLSSNILELTLITTNRSEWDFVAENGALRLPKSRFKVVADGQELTVFKAGFKRRPLYAPLKERDLRILNQVYLMLEEKIAERVKVTVQAPGGRNFETTNAPLRFNPAIHVNQVGYQKGFPKKAMVGYYLGSLGEMPIPFEGGFKLISVETGKAVFSGRLPMRLDRGFNDSVLPYQHVHEADFSAFDEPGIYRLAVEGMGASLPFQIENGTVAAVARTYALGLYHQRCGTNNSYPFTRFTHESCHTARAEVPTKAFKNAQEIIRQVTAPAAEDPRHKAPVLSSTDASLYPFVREGKIDVSGGHHDAGDYSKYTINSAHMIHALTFAADYFAGAGELDNLGIPESGDGKSDLLQEAKWEADFLVRMQDSDGGFYFLVYPKERRYEDNVLPDRGDPQIVWPKNTSATAAATAALAELAASPRFRKEFPEEADLYLRRALRGWAFLERALAKHGRDGSYQMLTHYGHEFLHDDELAWAAAALFSATGQKKLERAWMDSFNPDDPQTRRWSWWPMFEAWGNAVRTYVFATRERLPTANPAFRSKCQQLILETAMNHVRWARESAYGTSFPDAFKANRNAGWYFSSERAFDITTAYQLQPSDEMRDAVISNLNYEGGCNPVNVTYLTGLGWRRQREIVHQFAQNDHRVLPPTGIPLGNIQAGFAFLHHYKSELGALTFPPDAASTGAYPFYDRWGDSFNTTTEFVIVDQARSLASLAFWMAQTPVKRQEWKAAAASITGVPQSMAVGKTVEVRLKVPGMKPGDAQIVWESTGAEPVFAVDHLLTPNRVGEQWIEVEALWPDGRRVFASTSYTATASLDTRPHPILSSNRTVTAGTLGLYHLDGTFEDASRQNTALKSEGNVRFDSANLSWMRERKGAAIRVHDLGDRVTGPVLIPIEPNSSEFTLSAMIFVNAFKAYNRASGKILSLSEDWNSSIELIENLYEGPMIKGGTLFSIGKEKVLSALTLGEWHLVELTVSPRGYEARIDGKIVGALKQSELANWGRKQAILEFGNFDGYIDEVAVVGNRR